MSHFHGWPEKPIYRGHDGLIEFFNVWFEPWESFEIELREVIDLPGDRSLSFGHGRGRGRLSGAEVALPPLAQIVDFRAGWVLRVDSYSDLEEARDTAGLAEPDPG